jgi:hypothetical protein
MSGENMIFFKGCLWKMMVSSIAVEILNYPCNQGNSLGTPRELPIDFLRRGIPVPGEFPIYGTGIPGDKLWNSRGTFLL